MISTATCLLPSKKMFGMPMSSVHGQLVDSNCLWHSCDLGAACAGLKPSAVFGMAQTKQVRQHFATSLRNRCSTQLGKWAVPRLGQVTAKNALQ